MTTPLFTHPHSPSYPLEEEGEWVQIWVPKNIAAPTTQAGTPESTYINTPFTNNFDTMTSLDTFAPTTSSMAWDQSQMMSYFDAFYPSSNGPSSPSINEISSQFTNSPVEALLDDFNVDMDLALLNMTFENSDPMISDPMISSEPSVDLFTTNVDVNLDLSEFGIGLDNLVPEVFPTSLTSSDHRVASPVASMHGASLSDFIYDSPSSLAATTPEVFIPTGAGAGAAADFTSPPPSSSLASSPSGPPPSVLPTSPPAQTFACSESLCAKTFEKVADLRRHERKHRQPFRCDICDKGHLDKRALGRHLWAQHPEHAQKTNTRSERIKCPECDYQGRADNVARHMKRHSKARR